MDEQRVVSIADEALDTQAMGPKWSEYIKSRDPQMVREVPGKRLTWFTLRVIPTSMFNSFVQPAPDLFTKYMRAFQVGITKIEGFYDPREDRVLDSAQPTKEARYATGTMTIWGDEFVDAMPPVFVEEIGSIVYANSFLGRRIAGSYQPPPTLGHVLAARAHHDVAAILKNASQNSEPPSSSPPEAPSGGDA